MRQPLAAHVAAQIRAEMARQQVTTAALARRMCVTDSWVSRRTRQRSEITISDLARIAEALNVPAAHLLAGRAAAVSTPAA